MSDVGEHFALLQNAQASGTQLLTREVDLKMERHTVLLALDSHDQRHLLVPLNGRALTPDRSSQGVTLSSRTLRIGTEDVVYADLHCQMPALDLVFERLVEDVITRLATDQSSPVVTCHRVLDEWRSLLRAAGQGLSREAILGLVGELEVLRLLAIHQPIAALKAWRGPTKSVHDFVFGAREAEVKTTASVDGNFVSISNIDQLDPSLVESLHLLVVHAREDVNAATIDGRMKNLIELGVPREALITKVAEVGHIYEGPIGVEDRYHIRSVRMWAIGERFPGLRRTEVGERRLRGVSKVHYELALDAAPHRMSEEACAQQIEAWADNS